LLPFAIIVLGIVCFIHSIQHTEDVIAQKSLLLNAFLQDSRTECVANMDLAINSGCVCEGEKCTWDKNLRDLVGLF